MLNCVDCAVNMFENKISTYLCLSENASSFTRHLINIFLLFPNMTRAVYFYILESKFVHVETRWILNIQPKHCRLHNRNSKIWQGNLEDSFLDGICLNLSKFVVLKKISSGMFCIKNLLLPFCSLFTCLKVCFVEIFL